MSTGTHTNGMLYTDGDTGSLKVRRWVLRVIGGPDTGLERPLDAGTILMGTHENNDVTLKDNTVSRYHLEIQVRAEGVKVTDQDSTNGTYLGKTRLGSVILNARAKLKVGGETEIEIIPADESVEVTPFAQHRLGKAYGASPAMHEVFALLNQVAPTDSTVLLLGETGTGKDLLAEALHEASQRRNKPFVVVDCGALPRELMAAELFGHTKGAFTGATEAKRGLADEASGGTLFFDEIGELPLDLQPQLLRLLEKKEVRPIGETRPHTVDVRVVAATNKDLSKLVKAGKFREDLYFRLAVVKVLVPPLRKRLEDIPALVRLFLEQLGKVDFDVPDVIMRQLLDHDWPGNVRELRNVVERGLSLATARIASDDDDLRDDDEPLAAASSSISGDMMDMPFKEAKGLLTEAFEREYLTQLLNRHKGNISRAAIEAGIDRNYIHRLVKKYNLDVQR
ncbi:MAG: sigma 54-dependent Fis family transcriptional regulator [Deltaproteobacteria bacterium]|nr:sigma 54-dependent Fis family transcriptional regulator [Deltaproteobacteria bacterium]